MSFSHSPASSTSSTSAMSSTSTSSSSRDRDREFDLRNPSKRAVKLAAISVFGLLLMVTYLKEFSLKRSYGDPEIQSLKGGSGSGSGGVRNLSGGKSSRGSQKAQRTAFVCITGVLGDLELENKVKNIIGPLQNATNDNLDLHIAVVLQRDRINTTTTTWNTKDDLEFMAFREPYSFSQEQPFYAGRLVTNNTRLATQYEYYYKLNPKKDILNLTLHTRPPPQFRSKYEIMGFLWHHLPHLTQHNLHLSIQHPLPNPPVNIEYIRAIAIKGAFIDGRIRRDNFYRTIWRAVNDVRLLNQYQQCGQFLSQLDPAAHASNHPIIVIRAGEDAMLSQPLDPELFKTSSLHQNHHIPATTKRGHLIDQIDILSAANLEMARQYFERPLQEFYQAGIFAPPQDDSTKENTIHSLPEFLKDVYAKIAKMEPPNKDNIIPTGYPMVDDTKALSPTEQQLQPAPRRVFLCVTGQVQRMEMRNKLETMIKPILQSPHYDHVDVAMVVGGGSAVYNKVPNSDLQTPFDETKGDVFYTKEDVSKWFQHHSAQLNFSWVNENMPYEPNPNQPGNPQYMVQKCNHGYFLPQADHATHDLKGLDHLLWGQLRANFKMTDSYSKCWDAAVATGWKHGLYIRSRDDLGFTENVNTEELHQNVGPNTLMTSNKLTNGGINDRLAFVGTDAAKCYYRLPHIKFFDGSYLDPAMFNPESYFKRTYWREHCPVDGIKTAMDPRKVRNGGYIGRL